MTTTEPARVLVIAGHDPSGAGIHADIETCAALNCIAMTAITALTAQNTHEVRAVHAVDARILSEQLSCIVDDGHPIGACKIGLVPDASIVDTIARFLQQQIAGVPVVLDPVLKAGVGASLSGDAMAALLRDVLLPHVTVCTPNHYEAFTLTDSDDVDVAGARLNDAGSAFALITGADAETDDVTHRLYRHGQLIKTYGCRRLPGRYHGSGCTLSSAVATELAHGKDMQAAIANAQDFTWNSLAHSAGSGVGQALPKRIR